MPAKKVEIGTKECALYTLVNVDCAVAQLKEVRKNVRGNHKKRIDTAMGILGMIAAETKQIYGIPEAEAGEFIGKNRMQVL
jgi:hypothetical protein